MIPISAIGAVTFLIYQNMRLRANKASLSKSERKELEELRQRVHHLEIIASDQMLGSADSPK